MDSKGTTCKQALQAWQDKQDKLPEEQRKKLEDAEEVKLIACIPPMIKVDDSINYLKACKRLSLSTNFIDRIPVL